MKKMKETIVLLARLPILIARENVFAIIGIAFGAMEGAYDELKYIWIDGKDDI